MIFGLGKKKEHKIKVGIGYSKDPDPFQAAIEASTNALNKCNQKPKLSIVYTNSELDQNNILKGLNKILGKNWVGISTDKQFNNEIGFDPDLSVSVLSISSPYLSFNVEVAKNYKKNPTNIAYNATLKAMKKIKVDRQVEAYMEFTRMKNVNYSNIVRNTPYFILSFSSGITVNKGVSKSGLEYEFINGMLKATGPNVPIFGGSASSDLDNYLHGKANNVQFAHGKMYKNSGIVVFVVSDLELAFEVKHGYIPSKKFTQVTKVDKTGYNVIKLNDKEAVTEYANLLGVDKKKYLKTPEKFSFTKPFGLYNGDGLFIKEALPNPDKKTLHFNFHIRSDAILHILQLHKQKTLDTMPDVIKSFKRNKKPIALGLFCNCSGRRLLINGIEKKEVQKSKKISDFPIFGFFSFGEIGTTQNSTCQSHSQTVTAMVIYDHLLVD